MEGLAAGVRAASASRARAARSEPPPPTPRSRSLGLAGRSWSVWVWVGSHTNWTGVVGCACPIYVDAKGRQTQTYHLPYLTIFAFGSDHFGSTSGALGQLGEQGRWAGSRFWQVWRSDRVFSSVRAARGAGQVGWHSVLAGLVGLRGRARTPPTPKIGNRGLTGLALNVCVLSLIHI